MTSRDLGQPLTSPLLILPKVWYGTEPPERSSSWRRVKPVASFCRTSCAIVGTCPEPGSTTALDRPLPVLSGGYWLRYARRRAWRLPKVEVAEASDARISRT